MGSKVSKNKNIIEYRVINEFKKGYQPGNYSVYVLDR
jgi:hypothetical protein